MSREQAPKFAAGAAFRVFGRDLDFDATTREFAVNPDHQHKEGELDVSKKPYANDMWSVKSPLSTKEDLESHLNWLARILLPRRDYISELRKKYKVDIYCYKTCYTEQASLTLSPTALRVFTELDLELGLSLIFLPDGTDLAENRSD